METSAGTGAGTRERRAAPAWRVAEVVGDRRENPVTRTLVLRVPGWPGHLPGQHVDVRLTADDGYQATRSYSLAAPAGSGAGRERVELTVQRVPDGEVLGPVGGWFVWRPGTAAPVLLIAGGAGIVPVMAIARAWRDGGAAPLRMIYSLRSPDVLCYGDELAELAGLAGPAGPAGSGTDAGVLLAYTRRTPPGSGRPAERLAPEDIARYGLPAGAEPACYVCGPTGFVEAVAGMLTGLGHDPARIRTERFGPTGG
ncbi:oxidoreductase [Actinomadura sp. 21ATH]|uniref:oxidoreductase n=1 Tax=Actinomadura sp. 21ATH TaxID=1735444 RepID=UPI0035BFA1C1